MITEKMRKVLELLVLEGGRAEHYFVSQLCGLYADKENTLDVMKTNGYIDEHFSIKSGSSYSINIAGRAALKNASLPLPPDAVSYWLSEVLEQIEDDQAWDDGAACRVAIIDAYGVQGLQHIERFQRLPVVDTFTGGAVEWWNSRDPWATMKEYRRRKDDIRKRYLGE